MFSKLVFDEIRKYNLKIRLDKSEFLRKEVSYLGPIITQEGIKLNSNKTDAIVKYPIPKIQKQVKSFLGITNYYRKFMQDCKKSKTTFNVLRKGKIINR